MHTGEAQAARAAQASAALDAPLTTLAGIGPERARRLARIGLFTRRDLLLHAPRRLERGGEHLSLCEARARSGTEVRVEGRIRALRLLRLPGRRSTLRVELEDATGTLEALFFNQPWLAKTFQLGQQLCLVGKILVGKRPALSAPKVLHAKRPGPGPGELVARYALTDGIGEEFLRERILELLGLHAHELEERLEPQLRQQLGLPALSQALRALHVPRSIESFEAGRRRLAFEALLAQQRDLVRQRSALVALEQQAPVLGCAAQGHARLRRLLAHPPTPSQELCLAQLAVQLARAQPMRLLLQGDVGSGKTLVGLWACLLAAQCGAQAAFLAPTELLAEQHFFAQRERFRAAGVEALLLTAALSAAQRRTALERLASGAAAIAFGTHALFAPKVRFARLALAVIDEQQRFGVAQRRALLDKGRAVHALLMTATPIPRTLALTLYGELDVLRLEEPPPGRGALHTRLCLPKDKRALYRELEARLERGERAYWVLPRIDSGPERGSKPAPGAQERHAAFVASPLARFGVELVHGRLESAVRQAALSRFHSGSSQLLVATSLIEVGIDVPQATLMVIEGAESFGLAQLHQLRGRVGRGPQDSLCVLLGAPSAKPRLEYLVQTRDGFSIAEEDLRLRGMGELLGLRQAGHQLDTLFQPERDLDLLLAARELAQRSAGRQLEWTP